MDLLNPMLLECFELGHRKAEQGREAHQGPSRLLAASHRQGVGARAMEIGSKAQV